MKRIFVLVTTLVLFCSTTFASAATVSTTATNSKVLVNSEEVKFEAYNINGNNYFKLRDLAKALNGTEEQFEVEWNQYMQCIEIYTNMPYTEVGGELSVGSVKATSAVANSSSIYVNGELVGLTAYTIKGNNYFKLRDLGEAVDFYVGWDDASKNIIIDTAKGYNYDPEIPEDDGKWDTYYTYEEYKNDKYRHLHSDCEESLVLMDKKGELQWRLDEGNMCVEDGWIYLAG